MLLAAFVPTLLVAALTGFNRAIIAALIITAVAVLAEASGRGGRSRLL